MNNDSRAFRYLVAKKGSDLGRNPTLDLYQAAIGSTLIVLRVISLVPHRSVYSLNLQTKGTNH